MKDRDLKQLPACPDCGITGTTGSMPAHKLGYACTGSNVESAPQPTTETEIIAKKESPDTPWEKDPLANKPEDALVNELKNIYQAFRSMTQCEVWCPRNLIESDIRFAMERYASYFLSHHTTSLRGAVEGKREALAGIEHDQWIAWSKNIVETESISIGRYERWLELWRPYEELTEAEKDQDREWADKILALLKD